MQRAVNGRTSRQLPACFMGHSPCPLKVPHANHLRPARPARNRPDRSARLVVIHRIAYISTIPSGRFPRIRVAVRVEPWRAPDGRTGRSGGLRAVSNQLTPSVRSWPPPRWHGCSSAVNWPPSGTGLDHRVHRHLRAGRTVCRPGCGGVDPGLRAGSACLLCPCPPRRARALGPAGRLGGHTASGM